MYPYSSTEWDTLPNVILNSDTYWDPIVIYSTKAEDDVWLDNISDSPKLELHGSFDMHRDYVDRNIVQGTEIYYFDANTYD